MTHQTADIAAIAGAIDHLKRYVLGLNVAADCERRIQAAYADVDQEWERRQELWKALSLEEKAAFPEAPELNAKMRNMLEARSNARRIQKDADAIQTLIDHLENPS